MGQYWKPVNLDKKEFINPNALDAGLKLLEQKESLVGTALIALCAAMPEPRGGGDFPAESDLPEGARGVIGRWAGCRVALVGDYAEPDDLPGIDISEIHENAGQPGGFEDITPQVARLIEVICEGSFTKERGFTEFVSK